jgi:hypothetical protein
VSFLINVRKPLSGSSQVPRPEAVEEPSDRAMKTLVAMVVFAVLIILAVALLTPVKDLLWAHPWLHSTLVAVPGF